jgi:GNAT superfamily N-acetyltransferase
MHEKAFPKFFMTLMGRPFLVAYYSTVLKYKGSISLISFDKHGDYNGFAVGFVDPSVFYKILKKNYFRFILPVFLGLMRRPYLVVNIFRGMLRVIKSEKRLNRVYTCELASIGAVKKGGGIGSVLLKNFVVEAIKKGASNVSLTTDRYNNDSVISFYRSFGFVDSGSEKRGNREMLELVLLDI